MDLNYSLSLLVRDVNEPFPVPTPPPPPLAGKKRSNSFSVRVLEKKKHRRSRAPFSLPNKKKSSRARAHALEKKNKLDDATISPNTFFFLVGKKWSSILDCLHAVLFKFEDNERRNFLFIYPESTSLFFSFSFMERVVV